MTECNAIIEANNEIDELKRENKKLNESCVRYGFEVGRLEDENEQLKQQLNRLYNYFEDWYSDMTSENDFSEIWDDVKEDERWGDMV